MPDLAARQAFIDSPLTPPGGTTGQSMDMVVTATFNSEYQSKNVLGIIPGVDSEISDEVVIVCGHYDHKGVAPTGDIYTGADGNASGTAVKFDTIGPHLYYHTPADTIDTIDPYELELAGRVVGAAAYELAVDAIFEVTRPTGFTFRHKHKIAWISCYVYHTSMDTMGTVSQDELRYVGITTINVDANAVCRKSKHLYVKDIIGTKRGRKIIPPPSF